MRVTGHDSSRVSPFGHPRITARLPTPQGLSQAPTSFFGSRCQGIHHAPFIACLTHQQNNHYKVLASTIQISNNNPTPHPHPPHRRRPGTARNQATTHPSQHKKRGVRCLRTPTACHPHPPAPLPCAGERHQPAPEDSRVPRDTGGVIDDSTSEHHQLPGHERSRSGARAP